jgi:hypothetical protein
MFLVNTRGQTVPSVAHDCRAAQCAQYTVPTVEYVRQFSQHISLSSLEKMKSEEEMIEKPFIQKKLMYRFPKSEKSARVVARVENMVLFVPHNRSLCFSRRR